MANRWFTEHDDLSIDEKGPARPSPGLGSKPLDKFSTESTANWPKPPGPGGPDLNRRAMYPKAKAYVKKEGFC